MVGGGGEKEWDEVEVRKKWRSRNTETKIRKQILFSLRFLFTLSSSSSISSLLFFLYLKFLSIFP